MKLVRFGDCGAEKPGLVDGDGCIRDISSVISDWSYKTLNRATLEQVASRLNGRLSRGRSRCPPGRAG